MAKLIFENWKFPGIDGYPADGEWCLCLFGEGREVPDIFVGAYSEEDKNFYVNFGLGGFSLSREDVAAWTSIQDHDWEVDHE